MKTLEKGSLLRVSLVFALVLTLLAPIQAFAVEVDNSATEVHIPLVITANGEFSGAEIEFSYSQDLEYVGYQPVVGAENQVGTEIAGKTYAGFFSSSANKYVSQDGRLSFGSLVFNYTGEQAQSVTISEVALHTRASGGVSSARTRTPITIPVTRATGAEGSENGGGENDDSLTNPPNSGYPVYPVTPVDPNNPGTPEGAAPFVPVVSSAAATTTEPVLLTTDDAEATDSQVAPDIAAGTGTESGSTNIPESQTPLAGAENAADSVAALPLWSWVAALALVAAAALLFIIFWRRNRRNNKYAHLR